MSQIPSLQKSKALKRLEVLPANVSRHVPLGVDQPAHCSSTAQTILKSPIPIPGKAVRNTGTRAAEDMVPRNAACA
jgi:hypothetical protein